MDTHGISPYLKQVNNLTILVPKQNLGVHPLGAKCIALSALRIKKPLPIIISFDTIIFMNLPFRITSSILQVCTDITRLLGRFEGLHSPVPEPRLRRKNRIQSIQGSLAIEGNTVTFDQITDIIDNKPVMGPYRTIMEVKNAVKAYEQLKSYNLYSINSLCRAHRILMNGIMENSGKLRIRKAGIARRNKIIHVAPEPERIPSLLRDLFRFLKQDREAHVLIRSCVFHYELEYIHPFDDGNGRLGRLWQTAILADYHPAFEYVPVESVVQEQQKQYYKALKASDKAGESTPFIEFSLQAIHTALSMYLEALKPEAETPLSRIEKAQSHFSGKSFTRKQYLGFFKRISTATASRDLALGVKKKMLKLQGTKATSVYEFAE
jgi:Fic family protein